MVLSLVCICFPVLGRMANNELEGMWKEATVASFEAFFLNLLSVTEENN
jgi:hypothetical protein